MTGVSATAPTRIDFAGGTLDLPPLYLFHLPAYTVNVAIELRAQVSIVSRKWRGIALVSQDRKAAARWPSRAAIQWRAQPWLELPARLIQSLGPDSGYAVSMRLESPPGAGLGGSSTLGIALCGALLAYRSATAGAGESREKGWPAERLIEHAKSIETQTLRVPTGYQDFVAAYYGGANAIEYTLDGFRRTSACSEPFLRTLDDHLFLIYSGKPHFSGANNWELFKKHGDGDRKTVAFFEDLRASAEGMKEAFAQEDIHAIADGLNEDWAIRRAMLPEMSTPKIDRLIATAMREGAFAARVCGAGGGGCVAFLIEPDAREKLTLAFTHLKGLVLPSRVARTGLTIRRSTR